MILFKTLSACTSRTLRWNGVKPLIAKQGLLYYLVVFSVNLTWAIQILFATAFIKYAMAIPTLVLTPMAANKLTLSLRSYSEAEHNDTLTSVAFASDAGRPGHLDRRASWVGTSVFE